MRKPSHILDTAYAHSHTITQSTMTSTASTPPALYIPPEVKDIIIIDVFNLVVPDLSQASTLWDLCSGRAGAPPRRLSLKNCFKLRYLSSDWNARFSDISVIWTFLPLSQMDFHDVRRALHLSGNKPLTVVVTNGEALGLFIEVMKTASHRIRDLYIDLHILLWPVLSPTISLCDFSQLQHIFIGMRGAYDVSNAYGNPLGIKPTSVRHESQSSYTESLASFHHMPGTLLCVRSSTIPWKYFTPPSRLVTLHYQNEFDHPTPFYLDLVDFDRVFQSALELQELELWNVEAFNTSDDLTTFQHPNLRYIALRGPPSSVDIILSYLQHCETI